jgi:hypothetical protein
MTEKCYFWNLMRKCSTKWTEILTVAGTYLFVLVFILSLVLPYSSDYFSHDSKVRSKNVRSHEKVEVATDLTGAPAECSSGKLRDFQPEKRASVLFAIPSSFYELLFQSAHFGVPFCRHVPTQSLWQPSIVIALRKILI